MKDRIFIRLSFLWTVIFLIFFVVILIAVDPFQANIFLLILFYIVFFGLVLGILNLFGIYLRIPFWVRILIAISIIFILIVQSFRL